VIQPAIDRQEHGQTSVGARAHASLDPRHFLPSGVWARGDALYFFVASGPGIDGSKQSPDRICGRSTRVTRGDRETRSSAPAQTDLLFFFYLQRSARDLVLGLWERAIEAAAFLQHEDFPVVSIGSRQSANFFLLFDSFRSDLSMMHNPI
jgi:hypothetical protein